MAVHEKITIDFIDGYLFAMASFCHGFDFVPFYGSEEVFLNSENNIEDSLCNKLGQNGVTNFVKIEKKTLSILLDKWVGNKLLEGKPKEKKISLKTLMWQYNGYLLEFIEYIVSSKYEMYSFNIEHKDYEVGTEALCFHGNNKCLYIYFGNSD